MKIDDRGFQIISYLNQFSQNSRYLKQYILSSALFSEQLFAYHWFSTLFPVTYKIGIFSGIHGDELPAVLAVIQMISTLERNPSIGNFYEIFFYPVCNIWGVNYSSRFSEKQNDLNRCFWKNNDEGVVSLLEQELISQQFDGIISLHTDDTSEGLYGYVRGNTLSRILLEPSLDEASIHLARDMRSKIDTHHADQSIITECFDGILSAPENQTPKPFEIILETPHFFPLAKQLKAHITAIQSILNYFIKIKIEGADI